MRGARVLLCLVVSGFAAGGSSAQTWIQKVGGPGLGNPLAVNPLNGDIIYGAAGGSRVFASRDRGYTWSPYGNDVTGGGIIKSIAVSPVDTLHLLAGIESATGSPDRIMKSTDGGSTWTETWSGTFSYFGQPVEFSPLHPDTVYTMSLDTLYRSVDFGDSWDTVATGRGFNAWCDASIRPDSASVLYLGDNLSGIWKTTDHGSSWRKTYSTIGEIPSIAIDPLNPRVAYAGKFGGGGGMVKTTDWGETWHPLPVPSGAADTWWITCSTVHPGYVYYGTYTGDTLAWGIYISRDSGGSWERVRQGLPPTAKFNYGLLALDSLTVVALQASGIFKYQYPTSIQLLSPSGGEILRGDSQYTISWTSAGIYSVRLEFSSNNGLDWAEIADSIPASAGSHAWTVPDLFSADCLVRVSDALFTPTSDVSDAPFSIVFQGAVTAAIEVAENGPGRDTLFFGSIPGATDGVDTLLGETDIGPPPSAGVFDARWFLAGTGGALRDFRDTLKGAFDRNRYILVAQPGPGGYPITYRWDPSGLTAGSYILRDAGNGGESYSVDMRRDSALIVGDPSGDTLELIGCAGFEVTVPGEGGWVLMSLPVEVGDRRVSSLFPPGTPGAYEYRNGYTRSDTLHTGKGYWIKSDPVFFRGCPKTRDTVTVDPGWNMVGSLSTNLDPSTVVTEPEGLIISPFFAYGPSGYYAADTLVPGLGYWVKSGGPGRIILDAALSPHAEKTTIQAGFDRAPGWVRISEREGAATTLFFGPASRRAYWESPPPPPNGRKTAVFSRNAIAVFHENYLNFPIEFEIVPDSAFSEIFFSWNVDIEKKFIYILVEKAGTQEVSRTLFQGSGSISRSDSRHSRFFLRVQPRVIGSAETPKGFSMGDVFPNPVNPSTRIFFSLPSESFVSFKIFNLLGEVVSTADEEVYPAGGHSVGWDGRDGNGSQLSSGIYFIVMTARPAIEEVRRSTGSFQGVRKLMLLR